MESKRVRLRSRVRIRIGGMLVNSFFRGASRIGRTLPISDPERYGVERLADVPYTGTSTPRLCLDIYRSKATQGHNPIVLYIHGGGFRLCSKDTHWLPGVLLAQAGYTVFNIDYGLGPDYIFPDPLKHCAQALTWIHQNAHKYNGDIERIAFAGESAGANLSTALALCTLYPRPEPYAKAIYDLGIVPKAMMPAAGILQVSDPERFAREFPVNWFFRDRINSICNSYFPPTDFARDSLADPLLVLEHAKAPERPLPPFFAITSSSDPIHSDTYRLKSAIEGLGGDCSVVSYDNEMHAFHMFYFRKNAKDAWQKSIDFLRSTMPPS